MDDAADLGPFDQSVHINVIHGGVEINRIECSRIAANRLPVYAKRCYVSTFDFQETN
jgi:hypothetical protein